ncbi:3-phenylpropionate/trans-cinnamate dioxygenase ferredoxin subunit [Propionibacterium cyclohexanicum]|uniref:3-phenylpropionate/trans-cinnamate dioxygenase ferredoxin subunit n=1 Tax=Propionibacterium cyclohexanicum TaxID=64702 RepID=A0A1H9PNF0_9ACTN|nr:3-phenylpropionate/trans-cinnamate dioxygenase ferredoxin subunit [Propionibacterium cyclohexanicum]
MQVAQLDELTDGPVAVEVDHPSEGPLPVVLFRLPDGEVHALLDECSHGAVQLSEGDFDAHAGTVECYLHGSLFNVCTGAALNLPATQPVPVYPVRVEGKHVLVDVENPLKEN